MNGYTYEHLERARENSRKACLEKYGVEYVFQNKEYMKNFIASQNYEENVKKQQESMIRNTGYKTTLENPELKKRVFEERIKTFGPEREVDFIPEITWRSLEEQVILEYVKSLGYRAQNNTIFKHTKTDKFNQKWLYLELDIYLPECKIGIEYNDNKCHDRVLYKRDLKENTVLSDEMYKEEFFKDAYGIKVLNVWEDDYYEDKGRELFKIKEVLDGLKTVN